MMNYKRGLKVLAVLVLLAGYYLFLRYTGTGVPAMAYCEKYSSVSVWKAGFFA